ncbi:hypothetical protein AZH53_01185 [Methanomicrobiaceae archaeon CYW5]|uniref:right-handed parallel beta-helix repeat-containing protein n=1 Tax=Methanovulcanius yangii TaxID=1789227 RepID=UPI0029CA5609|nr:NosD domain-containing protein [Methanovulcanius yangii]MBT8507042.1 hypothetical protein [Methanovulcanius yangii]
MHTHWIHYSILAVLLLMAAVSGVQGATLVVAPSGADFTTIQPAVDAASPGDTIAVQAGTYPGDIVVRTPVTVLGTDGVSIGTDGELAAFIIEADGVTISDLACDGPAIGIMLNASSGSHVRECNVVAGDTGILFSDCVNCSVSDTSILADQSGLEITSSENIEIEEVRVNGGASGVTLHNVDAFALRKSAVLGCDIGIIAEHCGNGTIEETTFSDVDAGMLGIGVTDTRITGSTLSNVIQYLQMYNAIGCTVEADTMEGPDYFSADVFSDTVYACGPWTVSGWNFGLLRQIYDTPEGYLQFGGALNFTAIEGAESFTDPFILMEAEASAADLEGYDAETFGFYRIDGAKPVFAGATTIEDNGGAITSATATAPGDYALLAKTETTGPDLFYVLIGILAVIGIVLFYLVWRKD